jgi:hypothetical protein
LEKKRAGRLQVGLARRTTSKNRLPIDLARLLGVSNKRHASFPPRVFVRQHRAEVLYVGLTGKVPASWKDDIYIHGRHVVGGTAPI